jgi:hypothetical protein
MILSRLFSLSIRFESGWSRPLDQELTETFPMPGDPLVPSLFPREITSLFLFDSPIFSNLVRYDLVKLFSNSLRQSVERSG